MKEWLITDTHFDHDKIGVYCDRPDGWMDKILFNWRQIVKTEDLVIHLGDLQVGPGHNLKELMDSLPGRKVLVLGNHDTKSNSWYMTNGFAFVADAFVYRGVTYTHKPSSFLFPDTDINIHGHVHNSIWQPSHSFQRLLAIEHVNYMPVNLLKWTAMARSPKKWEEYCSKWKVPVITGKRKNA